MPLQTLKDRIPDYAKDLRLNLDAVLARSSLTPSLACGAALAAAFAAGAPALVEALRSEPGLDSAHARAALSAAALMGMNNVWYPFVEMADDPELKTVRAELRMNAYATHGGVDRASFELYALSASVVGKCTFCVRSHYRLLRESGFTVQQLRDVGRIASVVNAVAQVLAAESLAEAHGLVASEAVAA
ncbi:MAG TPA: carboxymuconolactone decarboxylase family protein [Casimicrobiaceae bacterium]|nr:carboxymuconolactone decarboxylase family protein [Casimicrobiaceae bacterium]